MRILSSLALLTAALLLSFASLHAQTATATLSGTVTDTTGAVIPGVAVAVTNAATGLKQTGTSNGDGLFTIPLLPPGTYTLAARHAGFAPAQIQNVVLAVGAHAALDVKLRVGDVQESVIVSADAGQIQLKTESGERSDVITNRQVRDLALPGRSYLYLMQTIPGMVPNGDNSWGNLVANGNRATMKEMSIDGASNLQTGANVNLTVGFDPEIIGEMKVLTSIFRPSTGKPAARSCRLLPARAPVSSMADCAITGVTAVSTRTTFSITCRVWIVRRIAITITGMMSAGL